MSQETSKARLPSVMGCWTLQLSPVTADQVLPSGWQLAGYFSDVLITRGFLPEALWVDGIRYGRVSLATESAPCCISSPPVETA